MCGCGEVLEEEEKLLRDVVVLREQKGGPYISRWPRGLFGSVSESGDNSGYAEVEMWTR
jgi:hypothetical protein